MLHQSESSRVVLSSRRQFLRQAAGALLMPVAGSALLAGCGGGGSDSPAGIDSSTNARIAAAPRLASVDNFRDIAGADAASVYKTSSGQMLRRGVFFRANALSPSAADLATLATLDIHAIYDLRTPSEITKQPDATLNGATWINFNLVGTDSPGMPTINTAADAIAMMENGERQMVLDAGYRQRLAQLFTAMANGQNAQLYHCSAGKDRTGWVTAVLLSLVDVPQSVIMQDYLLTNTYTAADIAAQYAGMAKAYGQAYADAYYPVLGVQASFLQAGLDQAAQSYGSMAAYITNGLALSAAVQSQLRAKLLS
ncbi:protein-tyrosine phosphatase [Caballeronia novacaledonica]|uniref:Protein-tyrosine phosphatase n=1 Tax=Caballeronia novacaledonica TaxID=1544861 RepID=A0A2U3HYM2_9BURK|nr:tyrosine-protein phosphatase [Caballeronia novacaledonica]SPB12906.1 protein-tyrosine phosphatase [Caballeronia novacaledonica]